MSNRKALEAGGTERTGWRPSFWAPEDMREYERVMAELRDKTNGQGEIKKINEHLEGIEADGGDTQAAFSQMLPRLRERYPDMFPMIALEKAARRKEAPVYEFDEAKEAAAILDGIRKLETERALELERNQAEEIELLRAKVAGGEMIVRSEHAAGLLKGEGLGREPVEKLKTEAASARRAEADLLREIDKAVVPDLKKRGRADRVDDVRWAGSTLRMALLDHAWLCEEIGSGKYAGEDPRAAYEESKRVGKAALDSYEEVLARAEADDEPAEPAVGADSVVEDDESGEHDETLDVPSEEPDVLGTPDDALDADEVDGSSLEEEEEVPELDDELIAPEEDADAAAETAVLEDIVTHEPTPDSEERMREILGDPARRRELLDHYQDYYQLAYDGLDTYLEIYSPAERTRLANISKKYETAYLRAERILGTEVVTNRRLLDQAIRDLNFMREGAVSFQEELDRRLREAALPTPDADPVADPDETLPPDPDETLPPPAPVPPPDLPPLEVPPPPAPDTEAPPVDEVALAVERARSADTEAIRHRSNYTQKLGILAGHPRALKRLSISVLWERFKAKIKGEPPSPQKTLEDLLWQRPLFSATERRSDISDRELERRQADFLTYLAGRGLRPEEAQAVYAAALAKFEYEDSLTELGNAMVAMDRRRTQQEMEGRFGTAMARWNRDQREQFEERLATYRAGAVVNRLVIGEHEAFQEALTSALPERRKGRLRRVFEWYQHLHPVARFALSTALLAPVSFLGVGLGMGGFGGYVLQRFVRTGVAMAAGSGIGLLHDLVGRGVIAGADRRQERGIEELRRAFSPEELHRNREAYVHLLDKRERTERRLAWSRFAFAQGASFLAGYAAGQMFHPEAPHPVSGETGEHPAGGTAEAPQDMPHNGAIDAAHHDAPPIPDHLESGIGPSDEMMTRLWHIHHPDEPPPAELLQRAGYMRAHNIPVENNPLFTNEANFRANMELRTIFGPQGHLSQEWLAYKEYPAAEVLKMPAGTFQGIEGVELQRHLQELIDKTGIHPEVRGGQMESLGRFFLRAEADSLAMDVGGHPNIDFNFAPGFDEPFAAGPRPEPFDYNYPPREGYGFRGAYETPDNYRGGFQADESGRYFGRGGSFRGNHGSIRRIFFPAGSFGG